MMQGNAVNVLPHRQVITADWSPWPSFRSTLYNEHMPRTPENDFCSKTRVSVFWGYGQGTQGLLMPIILSGNRTMP